LANAAAGLLLGTDKVRADTPFTSADIAHIKLKRPHSQDSAIWYTVIRYTRSGTLQSPFSGVRKGAAVPPSELITSEFSRHSTADDVIAGIDLANHRAVVTGASSGIGAETARALAAADAEVILAVRNLDAGHRVAASITERTGNRNIFVEPLELADRKSVQAFVDRWTGPLHILVNNAGVMAEPLQRTDEGWEHQFATNHLGHFGLAVGLHDALAADTPSRMVALTSSGHFFSPVVFDDLHFDRRPYDSWLAYGQSKTACVLFAVEATRRWGADGITANAVMPGGIRTELQRHQTGPEWDEIDRTYDWKTVEEGAATSVFVATSPLLAGIGGRYFEDCHEAAVVDPAVGHERQQGVAAYALDPQAAARLWEVSLELLNQ
jgi:NAD(P)-dependent dehydrogenase (short-subunit alcohol dehydrogenase family)